MSSISLSVCLTFSRLCFLISLSSNLSLCLSLGLYLLLNAHFIDAMRQKSNRNANADVETRWRTRITKWNFFAFMQNDFANCCHLLHQINCNSHNFSFSENHSLAIIVDSIDRQQPHHHHHSIHCCNCNIEELSWILRGWVEQTQLSRIKSNLQTAKVH